MPAVDIRHAEQRGLAALLDHARGLREQGAEPRTDLDRAAVEYLCRVEALCVQSRPVSRKEQPTIRAEWADTHGREVLIIKSGRYRPTCRCQNKPLVIAGKLLEIALGEKAAQLSAVQFAGDFEGSLKQRDWWFTVDQIRSWARAQDPSIPSGTE